jgi:hypothetical protein
VGVFTQNKRVNKTVKNGVKNIVDVKEKEDFSGLINLSKPKKSKMKKNLIIAFLSTALLVCTYFIINANRAASFNPKFRLPVPNKIAKDGIGEYRGTWSGSIYKKTKIITYEANDIRKYLDEHFAKDTAKIKLIEGYHWVVGFYMKREDNKNGNPRNSFYVIPTMQKDSTEYIDFYDNTEMYNTKTGKSLDEDEIAYNAGQL